MNGPYRAGGGAGTRCTSCGAELASDARLCAECGAERPAVRCASCMTLNVVGSEQCASCGKPLDLEPEPAPTQLLCPRGCGPLSGVQQGITECERCGGLFVGHETLAMMVAGHRPAAGADGKPHVAPTIQRPDLPQETEVTYLPCPTCNVRMNRTIFGKSSGVVVDVCKIHGTWFDARELTASLAFVELGGLELVEKRERLRVAEERRRREIEQRTQKFDRLNRPLSPGMARMLDPDAHTSADALRDIFDILLGL